MRIPSLKQLAPYGVAILSVALATVVRMVFDPLLGESAPLLLFVIADGLVQRVLALPSDPDAFEAFWA